MTAPTRSMILAVAAGIVLVACGKTTMQSDAGATVAPSPSSSSSDAAPQTPLPICEPWIVTELALPKDWTTYPIVATSGPEVSTDVRSIDHFVDDLADAPVGPFVLRYWHGRTIPSANSLTLRLHGCQNTPLELTSLSYWTGGRVTLRNKESVFILSTGGPLDAPIAVVRRLPR